MKSTLFFILLFLTIQHVAIGQCKDSTSYSQAWISCELAPNPNEELGGSHWLRYDLGEVQEIISILIWNNNMQGEREMGAREILLHYSTDGRNWKEAGTYFLPKGDGSSYYSGDLLAELGFLHARYILLTVTDTWGHPSCASIDKVSFRYAQFFTPRDESLWMYPNPANDKTTLAFNMEEDGEVTVEINDMLGKKVFQRRQAVQKGDAELDLNVSKLGNGLYILIMRDQNETVIGSKKLFIAR